MPRTVDWLQFISRIFNINKMMVRSLMRLNFACARSLFLLCLWSLSTFSSSPVFVKIVSLSSGIIANMQRHKWKWNHWCVHNSILYGNLWSRFSRVLSLSLSRAPSSLSLILRLQSPIKQSYNDTNSNSGSSIDAAMVMEHNSTTTTTTIVIIVIKGMNGVASQAIFSVPSHIYLSIRPHRLQYFPCARKKMRSKRDKKWNTNSCIYILNCNEIHP